MSTTIERGDLPRFAERLSDQEFRQGLSFFRRLSLVEEERGFERLQERNTAERLLAIAYK